MLTLLCQAFPTAVNCVCCYKGWIPETRKKQMAVLILLESLSGSHSGEQGFIPKLLNLSTVLSSLEETRTIFTPNDVKYLDLQKSQRDHPFLAVPLLMETIQHHTAHQKCLIPSQFLTHHGKRHQSDVSTELWSKQPFLVSWLDSKVACYPPAQFYSLTMLSLKKSSSDISFEPFLIDSISFFYLSNFLFHSIPSS